MVSASAATYKHPSQPQAKIQVRPVSLSPSQQRDAGSLNQSWYQRDQNRRYKDRAE